MSDPLYELLNESEKPPEEMVNLMGKGSMFRNTYRAYPKSEADALILAGTHALWTPEEPPTAPNVTPDPATPPRAGKARPAPRQTPEQHAADAADYRTAPLESPIITPPETIQQRAAAEVRTRNVREEQATHNAFYESHLASINADRARKGLEPLVSTQSVTMADLIREGLEGIGVGDRREFNARRLKYYRKLAGLSGKEAAVRAGFGTYGPQRWHNYENSPPGRGISPRMVLILSRAVGCKLLDLYGALDPDMNPDETSAEIARADAYRRGYEAGRREERAGEAV